MENKKMTDMIKLGRARLEELEKQLGSMEAETEKLKEEKRVLVEEKRVLVEHYGRARMVY